MQKKTKKKSNQNSTENKAWQKMCFYQILHSRANRLNNSHAFTIPHLFLHIVKWSKTIEEWWTNQQAKEKNNNTILIDMPNVG